MSAEENAKVLNGRIAYQKYLERKSREDESAEAKAKAGEKLSVIDKRSLYQHGPATSTLELIADCTAETEHKALATLAPVHQALGDRKIEYRIVTVVADNGAVTVRTYLARPSQPARSMLPDPHWMVLAFVRKHTEKVENRQSVWAIQKVTKAKRMLTAELDIPLGAVPQLIALCAAYCS